MSPTADFNRLAPFYRWMEYLTFGPYLALCRSAPLPRLATCRHALVLGDGDGRFTSRLLRANPEVRIQAVDASAAMLRALLRRAGPHAGRVQTHLADARKWPPAPSGMTFDLVATHFFLDCLTTEEVQSLADRLVGSLAPGALWLVSEFAIPPAWPARPLASIIVSALYRAFGGLTGLAVRALPDHRSALRQAGFTPQIRRTWLGGLLASELWRLDAGLLAKRGSAREIHWEIVTNVLISNI